MLRPKLSVPWSNDPGYLCFPSPFLYHPESVQGSQQGMDRRRQQRVSVEIPVIIWGVDVHARPFTQPATLRTISSRGGTLQGVCAQLKVGDIFDLQYQGLKAQFRVVWLGKHGSDLHGEVGIESLSADLRLWEFDLPRCATAAGLG